MRGRIQYFDILKGIAIFLVVMGHVLTMCIREIDNDFLFKVIERTHMPIFFFIAGFFAYKTKEGKSFLVTKLGQRALQLLLPFFVVSSLWILYFPKSGLQSPLNSTFSGLYSDGWKNGYWFTLVLFEITLLYFLISPILRKLQNRWYVNIFIILFWITLFVINQCFIPKNISNNLSLDLAVKFFPIYMFGVLSRHLNELYSKISTNSLVFTVAVVIGGLFFYLSAYPWEFDFIDENIHEIISAITPFFIVIVAIQSVKTWSDILYDKRPNGNIMTRIWTYLGKESLGIYLLHYFFLFPLGFLKEPLIDMGLGFAPSLFVSAFAAALIVAVTVGIIKIISSSPLLSLLLIGKNQYR